MKLWRQRWEAPFKMCLHLNDLLLECRLPTTNVMNRATEVLLQLLGLKISKKFWHWTMHSSDSKSCHLLVPSDLEVWKWKIYRSNGSPTAAVLKRFSEGRPPNWEYLGWECWYGSRKCLSFFDLKCLEDSAGGSGVKGVLIALLATMIRLGDCLQGLGHHSFSQIQLLPTSHNFVLKNFGQKNGFLQRSFATACSAVLAICLVMEQTSRGLNSLLPLW